MGVCCVVEDVVVFKPESPKEVTQNGPLSGQIISTMKDATRLAFQAADMRLLEANYECEVQVSSEALGKVYAVLSKRRAKIVKEGMKEGTPIFSIQAKLPVVESFGFSDQLLKQTSGAANAQLIFENDWAALEQDPYYTPKTEEELEESGTNIASLGTNIARKYMDQVRRRKGLAVEEKLVEHGEKQRTLKRNK